MSYYFWLGEQSPKALPPLPRDKPIARCMGGKFCSHSIGTCTATVQRV